MLCRYGVDPVRYYLLRESWISHDGDFSYENVNARLIAELADTLGNLFTRCAAPALNPTEGKWPSFRNPTEEQLELAKALEALPEQVDALYRECEFGRAIVLIFDNLRAINKHFAVEEPWKLVPKKAAGLSPAELENRLERLETVVYLALEAVRISCSLLIPVMPGTMLKVVQHLELPSSHLNPLAHKFGYQYSQHIPVSPLGKKKAPVLFTKPMEPKTK
jgi:methionyl-tRNA synthetase